jgi:hypothetical protein
VCKQALLPLICAWTTGQAQLPAKLVATAITAEMSSLLQLVDAHRGQALWTTNLKQALDDAWTAQREGANHAPPRPHFYICPPEHQKRASTEAFHR